MSGCLQFLKYLFNQLLKNVMLLVAIYTINCNNYKNVLSCSSS